MEKLSNAAEDHLDFSSTTHHLIEKLRASQSSHIAINLERLFIPLSGCYNPHYKGALSLEKALSDFVDDDMKKVLLLAGYSGAGKSQASMRFIHSLWENYEPGQSLPLWISLPGAKHPEARVLEDTLERAGLNEEQIQILKTTQSFILVLDAYDEVGCDKNLYVTNELHELDAKVVITCRHEYLYHLDGFRKLFTPFDRRKPNYSKSDVLYVKPFSQEQVEQYIKQYLENNKVDVEWNQWSQFEKAIDEIPGLKILIENPYVLTLAVEALPVLWKRYESFKEESERKALTRAVLYDVFIEQWFTRQEEKLKANGQIKQDEDMKPMFWDYAKRLSQVMHEHQLTQVYHDPDSQDDLFESEEDENPFSTFFDSDDQKLEMIRSACLLRELSPKHYGFVHSSLIEYFLTRELYESLIDEKQADKNNTDSNANSNERHVKKRDYFNERLMVDEERVMQFLADRVCDEKSFKDELLERLDRSKNAPEQSISGANAITILVKAGVNFNGADLRGVQIPGANISGGYFDNANLCYANLSNVNMSQCWFNNSLLKSANLRGIIFDELSSYSLTFRASHATMLAHHNIMVLSDDYKAKVSFIDIKNGRIMREFVNELHDEIDKITTIVFDESESLMGVLYHYKENITTKCLSEIRAFDVETGTSKSVKFSYKVNTITFSNTENMFYFDKESSLYSIDASFRQHKFIKVLPSIPSVLYARSQKYKLIIGDVAGNISILDQNFNALKTLKHGDYPITYLAMTHDDAMLISDSSVGGVFFFMVNSGEKRKNRSIRVQKNAIVFDEMNNILLTMYNDKIYQWDVKTLKNIKTFYLKNKEITQLLCTHDGRCVITTAANHKNHNTIIDLWNNDAKIGNTEMESYTGRLGMSSSGNVIYSAVIDSIKVYSAKSGELLNNIYAACRIVQLNISSSGCVLSFVTDDASLTVWNLRDNQEIIRINLKNDLEGLDLTNVWSHIIQDSMLIYSVDGITYYYDLLKNSVINSTKTPSGLDYYCLSKDGKVIISCYQNGDINCYDLEKNTDESLNTQLPIESLALSPDNELLAIHSDHRVNVWSVKQKKLLFSTHLVDHTVKFDINNDGLLIMLTYKNTISFWDVNKHSLLKEINYPLPIDTFIFSHDFAYLLMSHHSTSFHVFNIKNLDTPWELLWGLNTKHEMLMLHNADITNALHLSDSARAVFTAHGAKNFVTIIDKAGRVSNFRSEEILKYMTICINNALLSDEKSNAEDVKYILNYISMLSAYMFVKNVKYLDLKKNGYFIADHFMEKNFLEKMISFCEKIDIILREFSAMPYEVETFKFYDEKLYYFFLAYYIYKELKGTSQEHDGFYFLPANVCEKIFYNAVIVDSPILVKFLGLLSKNDKHFKKGCLDLIALSKLSESHAIASANAMTILVSANEPLNGLDFSNVKIPSANLHGGYFDHVNFVGADLSNVNVGSAWLRSSDFTNANLSSVKISETSFLSGEKRWIYDIYSAKNILAIRMYNKIECWDLLTKQLLIERQLNDIKKCKISPCGLILGFYEGNSFYIWNRETDAITKAPELKFEIYDFDISSENSQIFFCDKSSRVYSWYFSQSQHQFILLHKIKAHMLKALGQTRLLTFSNSPKGVVLWDIKQMHKVREWRYPFSTSEFEGVSFSSGGYFAMWGKNGRTPMILWHADSQNELKRFTLNSSKKLRKVYFSSDGLYLSMIYGEVILKNNYYTVVSTKDLKIVCENKTKYHVKKILVNHDTQSVIIHTGEHSVHHILLHSSIETTGYKIGHSTEVCDITLGADGKYAITMGDFESKEVFLWNIVDRSRVKLNFDKSCLRFSTFSPDFSHVILFENHLGDNISYMYRLRLNNEKITRLRRFLFKIIHVSHKSDDELYIVSYHGEIYLYNINSSSLSPLITRVSAKIGVIMFDHVNNYCIFSERITHSIKVWDLTKNELVIEFNKHKKSISALDVSSDGCLLASASADETAKVWKLHNTSCEESSTEEDDFFANLMGMEYENEDNPNDSINNEVTLAHHRRLIGVKFLYDNDTVLTCSVDNTITIWSVSSYSPTKIIRFHESICCMALNLPVNILAIGFDSGTVQFWKVRKNNEGCEVLLWSSDVMSTTLVADDIKLDHSRGLSKDNYQVLLDHGAQPSEHITFSSLITSKHHRSPVHHMPDTVGSEENTNEEENVHLI